MPGDTVHEPNEFEEMPGQANTPDARRDEALSSTLQDSTEPLPLGGGPYNGWRR
jgi:hypothetical protein